MKEKETIKLLVADNNDLIRKGLQSLFEGLDSVSICAEANDRDRLIELVKKHRPDVILIDYTQSEFSINLLPRILKINPNTRIVAFTFEQTSSTIVNAVRAGVTSYVKKDCELQEIIDSVIETARGQKFFCGQILAALQQDAIEIESIRFEPLSCQPVMLTERELEVIKHIAEGYTNGQIAEMLFVSNHTINTHRKNIMAKLGVNNTAGMVMYAAKTNLVSPNKFLFSAGSGL